MEHGIKCACLRSFIYLPAVVAVCNIQGLLRKCSRIDFTYRYVRQYFYYVINIARINFIFQYRLRKY